MGGVEVGELANLFIDLIFLPVLVAVLAKKLVPRPGLLLAAAICIVASHTATIMEDFVLPDFFNGLEHAAILAAGCLLLVFLAPLARRAPRGAGP
jgi:hypothetical protein